MRKVLTEKFFARSALTVARELIGKYLVRKRGKREMAYMITETEAYVGPHDKGCHAYKGRTKRTEILYAKPGTLYIYLIYGMYHMINVVTDKENYPAAVLIRGILNYDGPGKVAKTMNITKTYNGCMADRKSGVWFEDRGTVIPKRAIQKTSRIGIDYAEEWKNKPYRFVVRGT